MYAYCNNTPVMHSDPTGKLALFTAIVIGAIVGAVVNGVVAAIDSYEETGSVDPKKVALGAAVGTPIGGVIASAVTGFILWAFDEIFEIEDNVKSIVK